MNIKKDIPGILESGDKWFRIWILRPFGAQDDDYALMLRIQAPAARSCPCKHGRDARLARL